MVLFKQLVQQFLYVTLENCCAYRFSTRHIWRCTVNVLFNRLQNWPTPMMIITIHFYEMIGIHEHPPSIDLRLFVVSSIHSHDFPKRFLPSFCSIFFSLVIVHRNSDKIPVRDQPVERRAAPKFRLRSAACALFFS